MTKFSMRVEMMVYRFITSLLIGFFVGTYLITNSERHLVKSIGGFICKSQKFQGIPMNEIIPPVGPKLGAHEAILYIGVMSTKENLNSRVTALFETWAQHPNVMVEVFADNNGTFGIATKRVTILESGARIISLPGVIDLSYPPQKKSFAMLKYIYDNHVNKFDWFLRADDDAYVKIDAIIKLLSRVNSSRPLLIGHPGYGKHSDDYLYGENYCMGGTGVLFSKTLLKTIAPRLSQCLQELVTEHEDIELGRCIRKVSGVSCTNAWDTSNFFFQNFGGKGSYDDNIKDLPERKRVIALTYHANKDPTYQFKLHFGILTDTLKLMLTKITRMETERKRMSKLLVMKTFDDKAWNTRAGYIWETITRKSIYSAASQLVRGIPATIKNAAVENVFSSISELRKAYRSLQARIEEISIISTRYFVNPFTSCDMICRLKVRTEYKKSKRTFFLRNIYFRRTFSSSLVFFEEANEIKVNMLRENIQRIMLSEVCTENLERINFVMALSGRPENLRRFLNNYESTFLSVGENVTITVVYYPEKRSPQATKIEKIIDADGQSKYTDLLSDVEFVQNLLTSVHRKYPRATITFIPVKTGLSFARGAGLQIGAKNIKEDEIIFFCDVDLVFTRDILFRIRRSTIRRKQVYYPVFFSQYDPDIVYSYQEPPDSHFYFEEIAGFWRTFSYGMVSLYHSDFLKTGGFDLSIRGWGLEDLKFCDEVLRKVKLRAFKANEPAMVHIYHDKECPRNLAENQRVSCQKSRAQHFGPQTLMFYIWKRDKEDEDMIAEDPKVEVDNQPKETPVEVL